MSSNNMQLIQNVNIINCCNLDLSFSNDKPAQVRAIKIGLINFILIKQQI